MEVMFKESACNAGWEAWIGGRLNLAELFLAIGALVDFTVAAESRDCDDASMGCASEIEI